MPMSDARLSVMASLMAERLQSSLADTADASIIDLFWRDGLAVHHSFLPGRRCRRLPLEGLAGWTVSLAPDVEAEIVREVAAKPGSETGGVCLGYVSMIAKRVHVLALLAAPEDSRRSAGEFVLGTGGLVRRLSEIADSTQGALVAVGTWHSHLAGRGTVLTGQKLRFRGGPRGPRARKCSSCTEETGGGVWRRRL